MRIITFVNEKGGVGKTTLAVHVAAGLAKRGFRVALADLDPQGHAALMLGIEKEPGLYNMLVRREPWKNILRYIQPDFYSNTEITGHLFLLPSNVHTRHIPTEISDLGLFGRRLKELENGIDIFIIDTPPTPSMLHGSAYMATTDIIYPTKLEMLSFDGLAESMARLDEIAEQRAEFNLPAINIAGIVPMMYRSQTVDQSENLKNLRETFGDLVLKPIVNRTAWTEATTNTTLVWMLEGSAAATKEINHIIDHIAKGMVAYER